MIEIDIQMPEKCGLCPCFHSDNPMYCQAAKADKNKKIVAPYGAPRPEWCPLKEQEAKCLTKEELDALGENQFVWIEGRTGYLYCLQIIGICRGRTGVSDIQFNAPTSYLEISTNRYGKSYRIWTNKPTDEQMKAVKWE